jgi:ABC-type uncharacterized transport system substrate-binding protein
MPIARREAIQALALLLLPVAGRVKAQDKVPRIGVLRWGTPTDDVQGRLRAAFGGSGYVEGQNIAIEWRWATDTESARKHAREFVALGVDVIVTSTTPAGHAALDVTRTIPIVLLGSADPVGSGLVQSLARPGGNVTGVSLNLPAVAGKHLEILREALPTLQRVAFLGSARDPATPLFVNELQSAGSKLGLRLQIVRIRDAGEFARAFADMSREQAQAVVVQPLFSSDQFRSIANLAIRNRLPSISTLRQYAEGGGLLSYGPSRLESFRNAVIAVDKVLKGLPPGDIPIQEPTLFELVVNQKTAGLLGVAIPKQLAIRADEIIA